MLPQALVIITWHPITDQLYLPFITELVPLCTKQFGPNWWLVILISIGKCVCNHLLVQCHSYSIWPSVLPLKYNLTVLSSLSYYCVQWSRTITSQYAKSETSCPPTINPVLDLSPCVQQNSREYRKGGHCSNPCTSTTYDLLCSPFAQAFSSSSILLTDTCSKSPGFRECWSRCLNLNLAKASQSKQHVRPKFFHILGYYAV
jgi:hypothetical protein